VGAWQVGGPEVIEHPRVKRPVARMDGQHVDARRQARQDPVGAYRPEAEMVLAGLRRKGSRPPHGAGFIPAPLRLLRVANHHPSPRHLKEGAQSIEHLKPGHLEPSETPHQHCPAGDWTLADVKPPPAASISHVQPVDHSSEDAVRDGCIHPGATHTPRPCFGKPSR